MPIKRPIHDLPRANRPEGSPPSPNNFVAEAIADKWYAEYLARGEDSKALAIPEAGPYRGSFGSKRCDRALWYGLKDVPPSNPPGQADAWRMGLGSTVHEMMQAIIAELFPDSEHEVDIDLRSIGVPGSSHSDIVLEYKGKRTLVELKSINGFGFKRHATSFKGPPEGPRYGDVIQAALAAAAYDCEQIVIAYLAMEVVSPNMASAYSSTEAGRFAAEWHFSVQELTPQIEAEVERINDLMAAETPPPRLIVDPTQAPEGAEITDPRSGLWIVPGEGQAIDDTGDVWYCAYCWHRDKCVVDGR